MLRMTAALQPKVLTHGIPFGVDHENPSPSVMSMSKNRPAPVDLSLGENSSNEDESSLEDLNFSPRGNSRSSYSGPTLPPLHPQRLASQDSQHSFARRCRTLSSDTAISTGSSIVSIDAGKHGFITHDDSSATGSLVLAYEQGKDIPPAEYDLPKAILGISLEENNRSEVSMSYSVCGSEEEFQKLPYQIRSRLSITQLESEPPPQDNRRWSNIPDIGYGAMEEGIVHVNDASREKGSYPSPGNGSTAANTMSYSPETSPYVINNRGEMTYPHPQCQVPDQLQMPMQSTWGSEDHLPLMEKNEETTNGSNQTNVYISMLIVMVLFVGMIYGLFSVMKMMA